MAPRKRGSRTNKTNSLRSRKLASFLKDFDREGKGWILPSPRLPKATAGRRRVGAPVARIRPLCDARPFGLCPLAVQVRIKQIESDRQNLLKEVDNLYNIEILRLPKALREMNWLDYFGERHMMAAATLCVVTAFRKGSLKCSLLPEVRHGYLGEMATLLLCPTLSDLPASFFSIALTVVTPPRPAQAYQYKPFP